MAIKKAVLSNIQIKEQEKTVHSFLTQSKTITSEKSSGAHNRARDPVYCVGDEIIDKR